MGAAKLEPRIYSGPFPVLDYCSKTPIYTVIEAKCGSVHSMKEFFQADEHYVCVSVRSELRAATGNTNTLLQSIAQCANAKSAR